jgi:hypothetical protein
METQMWAFEVYMRKGKPLLALSAIKRALAISGPSTPTAHRLVVRFALQAQGSSRPVRLAVHRKTSLRAYMHVCMRFQDLAFSCAHNAAELGAQWASVVCTA